MPEHKQLVDIFRENGSFTRLFDLFRKKFESYGTFGTVRMQPTMEEERAIRGFLGVRYKQNRFQAIDFEKAAFDAGYSLSLHELLEIYYDCQLVTKREQKELRKTTWNNLFIEVEKELFNLFNISDTEYIDFTNRTYNWFNRCRQKDAKGYRVLESLFVKDANSKLELFACLSALWHLFMAKNKMFKDYGISTGKIRLPMFAAYVTDDSHAFDKTNATGRLLLNALIDINSHTQKLDGNDKERMVKGYLFERQVYRSVDILDDDLSSISHVFVPRLIKGTSPRTLNLREIEEITELPIYSSIYIIENPAVISFLVDEIIYFLNINKLSLEQLPQDFPILICTIGQARTASKVFLEKCLQANPGCIIYYSGDLDVPGIQMFHNMKKEFSAKFYAWRMDSSIYRNYVSVKSKPLSNTDLIVLQELEGSLEKEMIQIKAKVYQELLGKELRSDLINELATLNLNGFE